MKRTLAALLLSAAVTLAAQQARAVVIVSNLDTGTFNASTLKLGTQEGQSMVNGSVALNLSSILFPQTNETSTATVNADETFAVYVRNSNGSLGASVFNTFTLTFDSNFGSTGVGVTTATPIGNFVLQPNTGYWFVITSKTAGNVGWNSTSTTAYSSFAGATLPATSTALATVGGVTTYSDLAAGPQVIQVNGTTVVPEASSLAMLSFALVGVGMVTFRRRPSAA